MVRCLRGKNGISLIEVVIILAVAAILAGALTPTLLTSFRKAKLRQAQTATCTIKDAILAFRLDVTTDGFVQDATLPPASQLPVELAIGDGDIPELGPDGSAEWVRPVNFLEVDLLGYHIVSNKPGNDSLHAYGSWGGAYITAPIRPDPWGNRYMVNTVYLQSGATYDTVVLSAGSDEEVDSLWSQDGFVAGDDDIFCLVSAGTGGPSTCELTVCNTNYLGLSVYVNDVLQSPVVATGTCESWLLTVGDLIRVVAHCLVGVECVTLEEPTLTACPTTKTYAIEPVTFTVCNDSESEYKIKAYRDGLPIPGFGTLSPGECKDVDANTVDWIEIRKSPFGLGDVIGEFWAGPADDGTTKTYTT